MFKKPCQSFSLLLEAEKEHNKIGGLCLSLKPPIFSPFTFLLYYMEIIAVKQISSTKIDNSRKIICIGLMQNLSFS